MKIEIIALRKRLLPSELLLLHLFQLLAAVF